MVQGAQVARLKFGVDRVVRRYESRLLLLLLLLLLLTVELVDRHILGIGRRVHKRPITEIHAMLTPARECRRQVGCMNVGECGAVGRIEAAVDGHTEDGGVCSAHVQRKADDVTHSPLAAVSCAAAL